MLMLYLSILLASLIIRASGSGTKPFVGGYVMLEGADGLTKLSLLSSASATLPLTRIFIGFFSPTMVYVPGSKNLSSAGLNVSSAPDGGFAEISAAIANLTASGIDVLLSLGGWDYNCWGYAYCRYSVAGYGTSTPNYWKVTEYCGGSVDNASPANEWCYTCEPPSANETFSNFAIFPEPTYSPTWQAAVAYVTATAGGGTPVWTGIQPGTSWTDPATGITAPVPGSNLPAKLLRDPYADIVSLAVDIGATGVDIDYEEDWHADMTKNGPSGGPWTSEQTVYKFSAILKDVALNIAKMKPSLLLSTAAGAASAWSGNWWGGNLKGIILDANQFYPDLINFVATTGGINVMTYDLSDDESHYECPDPNTCTLDQQVAFYMQTFSAAGISANVGYETGTPAYPDPIENPTHQLPLTTSLLQTITQSTQKQSPGGFFWEIFKQPVVEGEATPTQVAQAICNAVLPGNPRCTGTIPVFAPSPPSPSPPSPSPAPAPPASKTMFSTYFANWAQYHSGDYSYAATDLAPIASRLSEINYAFIYFCPPPGTNPMPYWSIPPYGSCSDATAFQLMSVDAKDPDFIATIVGFKATNPSLKVMLSVGGWNFPSAYFSAMAATASTRATFVNSVKQWMAQYNVDGVDIDWEYPCSSSRSDPVEISCQDFQTVVDAGGSCPEDTANIVLLFSDLRAGLGKDARITVASQAAKPLEIEMAVASLEKYVDAFHLMTYDYAVSDITGAVNLSPNAPLFTPSAPGTVAMSINYTVSNYLAAGVNASLLQVGIALYGHTFFAPGLADWSAFGALASNSGACCGPLKPTMGGQPGKITSQCGTYMYSEIVAATGGQYAYDNETQSDIAYFPAQSGDSWTPAGTWITYTGKSSAKAITDYATAQNLGGVFVFDSSMDSRVGGAWTYEMMNVIADQL
jgi:GH18 family chitinase